MLLHDDCMVQNHCLFFHATKYMSQLTVYQCYTVKSMQHLLNKCIFGAVM